MKNRKSAVSSALAAFAMLVIILDTKTALFGANDGVQLCIRTVIPSLFPFFVLSGIINSQLLGRSVRLLRPVCKLCRISAGAESLLLLGFLAGYPVGAQMITQAYKQGKLSKNTAKRMLGFCNNAGPAFLFGMLSPLFVNPVVPWTLWGIHILSACIVGFLLPSQEDSICEIAKAEPITLPQALQNAVKIMAAVCGWVVLFRILLGFCERWFLWRFPKELQVLFCGLLELANGCVMLKQLPLVGMQFTMASVLLSFGGLCVGMQTCTATEGLGTGYYFPGKALQTSLSLLLSLMVQPLLFSKENQLCMSIFHFLSIAALTGFILVYLHRKKVVAINRKMLYNIGNKQEGGTTTCCSERK